MHVCIGWLQTHYISKNGSRTSDSLASPTAAPRAGIPDVQHHIQLWLSFLGVYVDEWVGGYMYKCVLCTEARNPPHVPSSLCLWNRVSQWLVLSVRPADWLASTKDLPVSAFSELGLQTHCYYVMSAGD